MPPLCWLERPMGSMALTSLLSVMVRKMQSTHSEQIDKIRQEELKVSHVSVGLRAQLGSKTGVLECSQRKFLHLHKSGLL